MSDEPKKITSFDWKNKGILPDIENQGTAGVMESQYKIKTKVHVGLSRLDIFNQMSRITNQDEPGCTLRETLEWIIHNGCIPENACPYTGIFNPNPYVREPCMKMGSYLIIDLTKELKFKPSQKRKLEEELESEIQKAPVIGEMIWIDEMEYVKGEVYSGPEHEDSFENAEKHAVIIVGFGEEMKGDKLTKFWVIQNSHDIGWGENGFGKIDKAPCTVDFCFRQGGLLVV